MHAITLEQFGGPEALHLAELDDPRPGPGQVLVRVRAAGVNGWDTKVRSGAVQSMAPVELPTVLGLEVAGTVEAVGADVEGTAVGDDVLGFADGGGYAELALATTVAPKPAGLSWEQAAALPVATETALRVLRHLGVTAGETLLVHGAAGGVGSLATQLAVAQGVRVLGTASPENHGHLAALGATPLAYGEGLVERVRAAAPEGVDAVLDVAGRGALPDSITLRGGTSRIVTIADPAASDLGVTFSARARRDAGDLADVARRAAAGELEVVVGATFPLAEAAAAHAAVGSGHARGKTVLLVG